MDPVVPSNNRIARRFAVWGVFTITTLWVLHTLTQYFLMGLDRTIFMRNKVELGFEPWTGWRVVLGVHVAAAVVAMAAGAVALILGVLKNRWSVHVLAGRTYAIAVIVSAGAGLPLAFTATGGTYATVGFLLLNAVWLTTVAIAYVTARRRDFKRHPVWAIRSYAVTYANLTLHVLTALLVIPLGSHTQAYTVAVWLSWMINLNVAEIVVRRRSRMISPAV